MKIRSLDDVFEKEKKTSLDDVRTYKAKKRKRSLCRHQQKLHMPQSKFYMHIL